MTKLNASTLSQIDPELAFVLLPDRIDTLPPVAFSGETDGEVVEPADSTKKPPAPLLPLPTVTYTAPPRPQAAAPVPMYKAPLLPHDATPVDTTMWPLTPAAPPNGVPALKVRNNSVPLLLTEP